ncbi:hypothetical protein AALO_G00079240 [Alosa alosa]|uniref:Uncharacterized protein n=1 Tax=Alosa alosa TaxID=278164 RepID=A0AAV6GWT0_9TELE|nr:hypothetical protein AALO_G00079240 [Alosa alosa]
MKIRHIKVLLLLSAGLCVVSFFHFYKTLNHIPLFKELSDSQAGLKHLAALGNFIWEDKVAGRSSISKFWGQGQGFMVWRPNAVKNDTEKEVRNTGLD